MNLLETRRLTLRFGGLTAVQEVDLAVQPGRIFSLIGPNGAGKTSVFNAITGLTEPAQGGVFLEGRDLRRPFTPQVAAGIAALGLLTGILFAITLHLEPLWSATVVANYEFRRPFPWGRACGDALRFLAGLGFPAALGFLSGAAGAWAVWHRQRRAPHAIAERGITRTFQNVRLFRSMTALENVLVGMDSSLRTRLWHSVLRLPLHHREEREAKEKGMELLEFVGLKERAGTPAGKLPYGDQRRLEIARALAAQPRLLLLDEPAAGMNPTETGALMELIRKIRDRGVTLLLIEHHMKVVMGISDRIAVLDHGLKIAEGTPGEIRADPRVIEAYLGKEEED